MKTATNELLKRLAHSVTGAELPSPDTKRKWAALKSLMKRQNFHGLLYNGCGKAKLYCEIYDEPADSRGDTDSGNTGLWVFAEAAAQQHAYGARF